MNKIFTIILLLFLLVFSINCSIPDPRSPINHKSDQAVDESIAFRNSINQSEIDAIQKLIANDSLHTYLNSNKGFWYAYQTKNEKIAQPKFGDEVVYNYQIEDLESKIIYSFGEIGVRKYKVDQQNIEEGLREGIKILNEGEQAIFLFPSFKMHSFAGDRKKIRPLQSLKVILKLIKINVKNEGN